MQIWRNEHDIDHTLTTKAVGKKIKVIARPTQYDDTVRIRTDINDMHAVRWKTIHDETKTARVANVGELKEKGHLYRSA